MSLPRFLLLFCAVFLPCIGYTFVLPLVIKLQPHLAFLQTVFEVAIYLGEFFGGTAFLYAGALGPDSLIDKFRRSSLFTVPPSFRRLVTRASFLLAGIALIAVSIASFSAMIA